MEETVDYVMKSRKQRKIRQLRTNYNRRNWLNRLMDRMKRIFR